MAKRRADGEGSIRKYKNGRWEGRYTAGRAPVTGKVIYKKCPRQNPGGDQGKVENHY